MTLSVTLSRICRRHFTKIVIGVAVIYLICAVKFFGTDTKEKSSHHPERHSTPAPVVNERQNQQDSAVVTGKALTPKRTQNIESIPKFQAIDPTEEHRKKRLRVLKEAYAVPHPGDNVYKLNESLSRTIDLDRPPTDLRPEKCKTLEYNLDTLPTVSVIFPIYNEALSMLLRAVHSVINNTPQKLLVDVILVDDDSKNENLKEALDRYVALLPDKVKVLRNEKREGLIRARMRGAAIAKGEVLMFQDVHTEFSQGWAEPILAYIQSHPNTIVQPVVEELQVETIQWPKL